MKTLIAILIITSFLQSAIIPLDLVLVILICRAFVKEEKENFYLAFGFGILVPFLNGHILGLQSIIYLLIVFLTHLISKSRFAKNSLYLIVPSSFVFLSLSSMVNSLLTHMSIQLFPRVILETLLCVPVFYFLRVWEERFIVRKDIKLKV